VLSEVAARNEGPGADLALEGSFSGMDSLVAN
jgi:hypothetical protein